MHVRERRPVFPSTVRGEVVFVREDFAGVAVYGAGGWFAGGGKALVDGPGVEETRGVGGELEAGADLGGFRKRGGIAV